MKRGQISLEYLIVVSFVVFMVITLIGFSIFYTSGARDRIKINQLGNFANKLITSAETVYFAGEPSKVTITAYLPGGVQAFSVQDNSLVFDISTDAGVSTTAFTCSVPLDEGISFSLNEGAKKLKIEATASEVTINEVS